jgi:hypothetical protein
MAELLDSLLQQFMAGGTMTVMMVDSLVVLIELVIVIVEEKLEVIESGGWLLQQECM